jgi:hypothetical protein
MDVSQRTAALTRLEPLVGDWTIEAIFSFAPEPTPGRVTFEWELGGQFLLERSSAEHPDAPSGLMMIAVAEDGDGYVQHYFDSRGVVRTYRMTLRDGVWTLLRDRPDFTPLDFAQRYTGTFDADERTITGQWETSHDGGTTWEHDFALNYRRS